MRRGHAWRSPRRSGASVCALLTILAPALACADDRLALTVKALDLYKLAPFVDWPAGALGPAHDPFAICVVGHDPFGAILDQAVAAQQVADRPIIVRRLPVATPDPPCQIMFIGGSAAQSVRAALQVEEKAPVLTVTDESRTPGVVDYLIEEGRVRFRIDDLSAAAHGLTIRAQLLNLAVRVTPRRAAR